MTQSGCSFLLHRQLYSVRLRKAGEPDLCIPVFLIFLDCLPIFYIYVKGMIGLEKERLKLLRLLIPGFIILLFIIPGFTDNTEELKQICAVFYGFTFTHLFILIPVIILGFLYYTLNIRWFVWKHYNKQIQDNIIDTLLINTNLKLNAKQWYELRNSRKLIIIFYNLVDNDESLKEKAKSVRLNGLLWTSCFDIMIISGLAAAIYSLLSFIMARDHYIMVAVFFFWFFFVFWAFSSLLTHRHKSLSNDQLEVIKQRMSENLSEMIAQVIDNQ